MGNLWQFFGLPDPDAGVVTRPSEAREAPQNPRLSSSPEAIPEPVVEETILEPTQVQSHAWNGPVTPDGEPFHDLSNHNMRVNARPNRALRYVKPDEKHRIRTRDIARRVAQGDTIIVDLRTLVHMESHQQACRRELRVMCEQTGVGVFALDTEDKLLLIPGADVVVDIEKHELGLTRILNAA
tara:strand:- start:4242 stop:4790 length:549 start_codon:yes stop_codon:yes gene_type:complete